MLGKHGVIMVGAWLCSSTAWAGEVVSETTTEPYPGVEIVERIEANPNNRIYAAYVSLCTDGVQMTATEPATGFRTPGGWGGDRGVQLAINGDFYTSGPQVYGVAVGGGIPWPLAQTGNSQPSQWYYQRYGWIAFGDGWVEFNHTERTKLNDAEKFDIGLGWRPLEVTTDIPPGTLSLVSGFPELVIEGQPYTCSSPTATDCFPDRGDMHDRHPRSAMGLTEDRRTLILVAVDGRDSPSSVGMYGSELAALMADLGAWEAFNIDGGGSTGMWVSGQGYMNQPSDGSARAVANHWGVFAGNDDPAGSCFQPGGCFPTALVGAEAEPFADMAPGSYAHAEAIALYDGELVSGCATDPQRMYCPRCGLTRAALARIVAGAAGLPLRPVPSTPTFDDVASDSPSYAAIEAAVAAGLMNGCSATSFCPGGEVTRGELAGVVRRAVGWDPADPATPTYADLPASDPAYSDVESLAEHCIDDPCDEGFCPARPADRAEAAVFVARAFGLVPEFPCTPSGETTSGASDAGDGADAGDATGDATSDTGSNSATTSAGVDTDGPGSGLPDTFGVDDTDGGCSCRTDTDHEGGVALTLGLLLLALRRRRSLRRDASQKAS